MSSLQNQDIIDKFCSVYTCTSRNGYPSFKPSIQKRLKSRMEKLVLLHPEWDDKHYVQYFLRSLNDNFQSESEQQLSHLHLIAYFDLARCHFVQQFSRKFPFPTATCLKFFDLTSDVLYNRDKFKKCLNSYDPQNESGANLKTYLQAVLRNIILDQLNFESPWHLLCDVELNSSRRFNSEKQKLQAALLRQGIIEPQVSQYIFAWQYFVPIYKNNRVYNPKTKNARRWPEPEQADFEEAATDYNTNRFQPDAPLQVSSGKEVTPELIQKWMNICIEALQKYPNLVEISRDTDSYEKQYDQSKNPGEVLESEANYTDFIEQIDPIFQEEIKRIDNSVVKIRSKIPSEFRQAVMPLCYPHELSFLVQEQFAKKVGVNQGTIARYIANTYKVPLLNRLEYLTTERLGADSQSWARSYVEKFLDERFSNPNRSDLIEKSLIDTINSLEKSLQVILKLHYGQRMTVEEINNYLRKEISIESGHISQELLQAKNQLEQSVINQINTVKIYCVNSWLKRHYRQIIEYQLLEKLKKIESPLQDVIKMHYCQKLAEHQIANFRPDWNVKQAIIQAKQQLQNSLLEWSYNTFGLSLEPEKEQVIEVVEVWLKMLYSSELELRMEENNYV